MERWRACGVNQVISARFVDSVTDRYSELIIYGGASYHFLSLGEPVGGVLVFGAAAGSVLVSYVKARAEALGYEAKVGILTRVERYLVLAPRLVFNQLFIGLRIIAVFANLLPCSGSGMSVGRRS